MLKEKSFEKSLHRILMISGYSYPERVANSAMELTLYKTFARYHISIDVITPTPIRGISNAEHEKYKHVTEEDLYNGWIKIHRYKLGKEKETIAKRASRYIRGAIKAYFKGISYKQSELIYSVSTPPIQGIVCGLIKKKLKIPFVYYLCDVFPDSMVHGGLTHKGSLVWRIGRIIENYIYKKADKIVVINHDFKKNLLAKGVSEDKIGIVYNWIDPNLVLPIPRIDNKLFDDYSLDRDGFYISYAGNLGTAQDVNILVDAAEMLRGEKINFVIFGNGVEEGSIRRKIERLGLTNIHMFPMQPSPRISEVYSLGNASFVSCKPGFGGVGMPSKTWSIMSAGTPVLLCFDRDTELEEIVIDNNCGVFSVAGDVYGLAETIRSLYRMDPTNLRRLGDNGRNFVINNMSAEICTDKLVEIFASVCKKTIHNNEDYNH